MRRAAQPLVDDSAMEMLRRSSVFAAEVFDRSPTDKDLVSQAKALCRDYIRSRLSRAGIGWSKADNGLPASGGTLAEVSSVLLWLGEGVHLYAFWSCYTALLIMFLKNTHVALTSMRLHPFSIKDNDL